MATRKNTRRGLRKKNSGSLVGVALLSLAIIVAAVILSRSNSNVTAKAAPAPVVAAYDMVRVPVPTDFVAAGTSMKNVKFRNISFPEHQVPEGAIRDISPYLSAVALAPLPANLPLFKSNLSMTAGVRNPVIDRIPEGMRAMTIRVDATSAVEGWAGTGAIVDVLLVTKQRSSVVAEKVKILSAERSVSPVDGSAAPSVPSTVTLLVTQEQCLAINTANNLGKIAFALRSDLDGGQWRRTSYTADRLKGGAIVKNSNNRVTGYIKVHGQQNKGSRQSKERGAEEAYALSDGHWIKTDVKPEGFFAAGNSNAKSKSSSSK